MKKREPPENWHGGPPGRDGITVTFRDEADMLLIAIGHQLTGRVEVEWTPCRFGGQRPWFRCPRCGSRCARLHFVRHEWGCRRCGDLRYQSQLLRRPDRCLRRAERVRREIFSQAGVPVGTRLPPKPRYMKLRKYWKLEEQILADELAFIRREQRRV